MPVLSISLLGTFAASFDNQPISSFKTHKVQALLIYLAVEGDQIHKRENLMHLLWPDISPESAQINLRQTIYRLHQAIPEVHAKSTDKQVPLIISDHQNVGINPEADVRVDIDEFNSLIESDVTQALSLYRGDFLENFYVVDSGEYEQWAARYREDIQNKALSALHEITRDFMDAGDYKSAQSFARKQLKIDNLSESACRQLMTALALDGQRNAALSQFQVYKSRLDNELGIEPSEDTIDLYKEIQAEALVDTQFSSSIRKTRNLDDRPIFLLTDIEGSTRLWDEYHEAMLTALMKHNEILETQISKFGGRILELRGDGVKAVFEGVNPLQCLIDIQKGLSEVDWGVIGDLRIRIGVHGLPTNHSGYGFFKKDDNYYGPVLNHTGRIMDAGFGGQILVSDQVRQVCSLPKGASWYDFGNHQVKDLDQPIHIFGLLHPNLPTTSFPPLRTISNQERKKEDGIYIDNNLPSQLSQFIGRYKELTTLSTMFSSPDIRLVTIVGPGGMGKTRLAVAAGENLIDSCSSDMENCLFPDGIFFVSLAPLNDPDKIIPAIIKSIKIPLEVNQAANTLGGAAYSNETLISKLNNFLHTKKILIILDNFEHMIEGVDWVSKILQAGPNIKILTTSRERLHIQEEQIFPIQGLDIPDWENVEEFQDYTAIELFLQSAQRIQPGFKLEPKDMVHLTHICNLVGGMPLGLELAASWVDILSIQDIAVEIQNNIDFLETEVRNIPPRHRSIRAVFDSSWQQLESLEKEIFPKFSVFRGGFNRTAAHEITGASIRELATFVSKSLISYNKSTDCYQIHELLRQYGEEMLSENPYTLETTINNHCTYYCKLSKEYFSSFMSGDHLAVERLETNISNIQIAWKQAVNQEFINEVNNAINGISMYYQWNGRGRDGFTSCQEAIEMLTHVIDSSKPEDHLFEKRVLAQVLSWQGYFKLYFDITGAFQPLEKSIRIIESLEEMGESPETERILNLHFQGLNNYLTGDFDKAQEHFHESLARSRDINLHWMVLRNQTALGDTSRVTGNPRDAMFWFEQCLKEARLKENHWGEIDALRGLGWASRTLMSYDQAKYYYEESLALSKTFRIPIGEIRTLESLGYLELFLGRFSEAINYFLQTLSVSSKIGLQRMTISTQVHIGVANWLSGEFIKAESQIEQALRVAKRSGGFAEIYPTICFGEYLAIIGQYSESTKMLNYVNTYSQGSHIDRFLSGRLARIKGWISLSERNFSEAVDRFRKSIDLFSIESDDEQVAWSQAGLACAEIYLGNRQNAQQLLTDALWTAIEIKGFIPMVFTLPVATLYLAHEEPEQAAAVYAEIQKSPLLAKAQFFKDTVYRTLPEQVISKSMKKQTELLEVNNELWKTAAAVLSNWIQIWMDEPINIQGQKSINPNSL